MSYGGRIAVLLGQAKAEEFSTLAHEPEHERLHKAERRTTTIKALRETKAEAIAFFTSEGELEVIQQTSAVILAALEPSRTETMPDAELAKVA
jgi:hypothetical protein